MVLSSLKSLVHLVLLCLHISYAFKVMIFEIWPFFLVADSSISLGWSLISYFQAEVPSTKFKIIKCCHFFSYKIQCLNPGFIPIGLFWSEYYSGSPFGIDFFGPFSSYSLENIKVPQLRQIRCSWTDQGFLLCVMLEILEDSGWGAAGRKLFCSPAPSTQAVSPNQETLRQANIQCRSP